MFERVAFPGKDRVIIDGEGIVWNHKIFINPNGISVSFAFRAGPIRDC